MSSKVDILIWPKFTVCGNPWLGGNKTDCTLLLYWKETVPGYFPLWWHVQYTLSVCWYELYSYWPVTSPCDGVGLKWASRLPGAARCCQVLPSGTRSCPTANWSLNILLGNITSVWPLKYLISIIQPESTLSSIQFSLINIYKAFV